LPINGLTRLIPSEKHPTGGVGMTFQHYLDKLDEKDPQAKTHITPLTFLSDKSEPLTPLLDSRRTQIMSILNFTPDSFWDGGKHDPQNPNATFTKEQLSNTDIFDIGGESTRPGSCKVSTDEELSRVLPAITYASTAISPSQAISIDTYHAAIASAALDAGAHIVNDISAGRLDNGIFRVVAQHDATVVLMHSRGTPQTMMDKDSLDYGDDLLGVVAAELAERVALAEEAGVRRWRIVLDPGFGFAKSFEQNIALLRGLGTLRQINPGLNGLPWLIGLSRKSFVRRIAETSTTAGSSDISSLLSFSNAAFQMAAIHGGADIIRVHDPVEAKMLVRVADAVWRNRDPLP
jgi:2-amino-4-hydroxy-6-hydroxymethyldihydropteridine diphosphokinase/dihydropteroate synthase